MNTYTGMLSYLFSLVLIAMAFIFFAGGRIDIATLFVALAVWVKI